MNTIPGLQRIRIHFTHAAVLAMKAVTSLSLWILVTSLLMLRPVVMMVLMPLGTVFFFLAVVVGFWAEARPIAEHRWAVLGIGLGSVLLAQLYDECIRVADRLRTNESQSAR